ncbi:MAG: putative endonuclease [Gammaproteobacteria bacterium]|jgi:putative endonuclease
MELCKDSCEVASQKGLSQSDYLSPGDYCIYILASKKNGAMYVGLSANLADSVLEHKHNQVDGITKLYNMHTLVFYEYHQLLADAIAREKQLKNWHRKWKIDLIQIGNPGWEDLFTDIAVPELV